MLISNNSNGYTLIELMISVLIGMMLIAAASATYIAQNRSFTAQESVAEVNTQSKIAHDLTSNDIRSAGFGVALDMSTEPVNGFTNIITPVDNAAGPDAITVVGGFRKVGSLWPTGSAPGVSCASSPSVPLGTTTVQIIYDSNIDNSEGPNASDRRFLSIDGIDFVEVSSCTIGGDNNCGSGSITLNKALTQNFPLVDTDGDGYCDVGRPVYLVEDITFCVNTTDNTLRRIRRNANAASCTGIGTSLDEVLADNVEDLQFAYAVDADNDGDADDTNGNGRLDDFVNGSAVADPSTIKAVRVNVLARTDRPDPQYRDMGSRPKIIENNTQIVVVDDYRRRWWQAIVSVRNN
jgi:Tfp pilus assembly protein PilW